MRKWCNVVYDAIRVHVNSTPDCFRFFFFLYFSNIVCMFAPQCSDSTTSWNKIITATSFTLFLWCRSVKTKHWSNTSLISQHWLALPSSMLAGFQVRLGVHGWHHGAQRLWEPSINPDMSTIDYVNVPNDLILHSAAQGHAPMQRYFRGRQWNAKEIIKMTKIANLWKEDCSVCT